MASNFVEKDPVKCYNLLAWVLSLGHTIPFTYSKDRQKYYLREGVWSWGYRDNSCEEYLLDDIQFALFDQGLRQIELHLSGREHGPILDSWTFIFTKQGLVEARHWYNTD